MIYVNFNDRLDREGECYRAPLDLEVGTVFVGSDGDVSFPMAVIEPGVAQVLTTDI